MGLKVGIDFGTSNSGVAISDGSQIRLLPIDKKALLPEVVKTILYFTKDSQVHIGQEAVELYFKHNVNRLRRYVKKWVGEIEYRGADMYYVRDVYTYVDSLKPGRLMQFIKTALRSEYYPGTQVFDHYYTLEEIISIYLRELKEQAELLLHEEITGVTLGRPVKFSTVPELDRKAEETLRQAAFGAGFRQVEIELEPVAAALFYATTLDHPQNVLVFDFGGGTLDLTVIRLGDKQDRKVFASGGIGIAGSDFDRTIIEKRMLPHFGKGKVERNPEILELVNAVPDWMALPDLSTPQARFRLEQAIGSGLAPARLKALESLIFNDLSFSFYNSVEASKIELSNQGASEIKLTGPELNIWELYTRYQFEEDIREYLEKIKAVLLETIVASGLELAEIDAVVKTGGSANIPVFSKMLDEIFGPERVKASNLFSSVTAGLAIKASQGGN